MSNQCVVKLKSDNGHTLELLIGVVKLIMGTSFSICDMCPHTFLYNSGSAMVNCSVFLIFNQAAESLIYNSGDGVLIQNNEFE